MAGYSGNSMSNNAVKAYESGEMPYGRWKKSKKSDIIDYIEKYANDHKVNFSIDLLKKVKKDDLIAYFLVPTVRHHTSYYFNETEFYAINDHLIDTLTDEKIKELISKS